MKAKEILHRDEINVANAGGATAILIGVVELADALLRVIEA